MKWGNLTMDPQRHTVQWKGIHVALTITEFLLLQALAIRPGFVKSRDQLMDVAYGDQVYVDDRTIDSHVKRLRKKCAWQMKALRRLKRFIALVIAIMTSGRI